MTSPTPDERASAYNPASMPASSLATTKAVWYRRPWFLLALLVVVGVLVSVLADVTSPITAAQDAADQNALIKQVNQGIAPCSYALTESFSFFNEWRAGRLTSGNLAQIPKLLTDDQTNCSLASGPIYDMSNSVVPLNTPAGKQIGLMYQTVLTWVTGDALHAIEDIQYSFAHPGDTTRFGDLARQARLLSSDRAVALQYLANAGNILGQSLTALKLPVMAPLRGLT